MSKRSLRSLGQVLAGLMCVIGLTLAAGCSQQRCKSGCQQSAKCPEGCSKACCKKATASKCPAGCTKPCCTKA